MIPRGADFPPDSAPPAKRRVPKTMRCERETRPAPSPPRAVRLPTGRRSAQLRAAVLQRCAGRTQGKAPHTLRVMTPGVFGPATARTATASISLLSSAASGRTAPALHSPDCAAHAPERNGNFSSPKRCGGLANPANALGSSRGLFSISPRKKRTGSVSSRFSPDTLSCSCFLSLEHFLRSFSPRLRRRGKRVSAFQVLKLFGRHSPQPESSCSGEASGRADARMTRSAQTLFFTDLQ